MALLCLCECSACIVDYFSFLNKYCIHSHETHIYNGVCLIIIVRVNILSLMMASCSTSEHFQGTSFFVSCQIGSHYLRMSRFVWLVTGYDCLDLLGNKFDSLSLKIYDQGMWALWLKTDTYLYSVLLQIPWGISLLPLVSGCVSFSFLLTIIS